MPVSVLYELAAPSTSEELLVRVQEGQVLPTLEALKEAKEAERLARAAERQARVDMEHAQQQLSTISKATQEKQMAIEHLSRQIKLLQEQIATLSSPTVEVKEVEKLVVPPEIQVQVENLQQQLFALTQQRDMLSQRVAQLGEEARIAAQKRGEGEQERRIHLNWYKLTSEFRASVAKILSQWPSSLDTLAFESDDWTRLSQTKELARRFLEECTALTQGRIIESTSIHNDDKKK